MTFDPYADLYTKTKSLRKEAGPALAGLVDAINKAKGLGKIIVPISHYPLKCSAKADNCQNDVTKLKSYFDIMF